MDNLEAYAWRAVRNIAYTRLRQNSMKLAGATLGSKASEAVLGTLTARDGTPAQIEAQILERELTEQLAASERALMIRKKNGYSSLEIAKQQGTTQLYVDKLFYRIKQKCRQVTGGQRQDAGATRTRTPQES